MPDPEDLIPDARDLIRAAFQLLFQVPGSPYSAAQKHLAEALRLLAPPEPRSPLDALAEHWEQRPS